MADLQSGRLDGWKAISSYFKRDRSTVTRWARERNLPVHRLPGGKSATVFALEHELAAWALANKDAGFEDQHSNDPPPHTASRLRTWRTSIGIVTAALVLVLAVGVSLSYKTPATRQQIETPKDTTTAATYVAARDAWARRTPTDLKRAISLYEKVILQDPSFAPGHSGLAEAWLIYREYGSVGDAEAFGKARAEARKALELNPNLAGAHRAMGFILYWWNGEAAASVAEFRQAIKLDDNDSQTHFWFANVLAEIGYSDAAEREYRKARLLSPGSRPIEVEYACAQWQAGRDALALKLMTELAQRYPDDATIHNCLAWIRIGEGDIVGFSTELEKNAKLRHQDHLLDLVMDLNAEIKRDPKIAHRILINDARREIAAGTRHIRETPAFYASAMGDRAELVSLMAEAGAMDERWYSTAITSRIGQRWRNDSEIQTLLKAVAAPRPALEGM